MDAFESVVAALLVRRGYWVQTSVKVELTKAEKVQIGRHSSPRWELDVVGYRGADHELLVLECKSYLDSVGVYYEHLANPREKSRYKLFTEPVLRRTVLKRLETQFVDAGFCARKPTVRLGLVAGRIRPSDVERVRSLFAKNGWLLWDRDFLREELAALSRTGYENMVAAVVSKLLLKGTGEAKQPRASKQRK